jgi:glycosyltransferase involved in cell wall biosynthesis
MFTIVVPTLNEGGMLGMTVEGILAQTRYRNYEVVVVDDGSTDGSVDPYERHPDPRIRVVRTAGRGVARARNLGAAQAEGEFVVFLDAHCRVSPDWLDGLAKVLSRPGIGVAGCSFARLQAPDPRGCGVFWADHSLDQHWFMPQEGHGPYDVPLTIGACQAFRMSNFLAMGGYDDGFTRWGFEDVEICLRAWLLGYRVTVNPDVVVAHHFRESRGYEVDDEDVTCNFVRMLWLHFSEARIRRILEEIAGNPYLPAACERVERSDAFRMRGALERSRVRSDDWFFARVNPPLPPHGAVAPGP